MRGVFVTGTDTNVGKTVVSAWLARSWKADYWKPVQSGIDDGLDADVVSQLAPGTIIHPSTYLFQAPLAPDQAAKLENETIHLDLFHFPITPRPVVVEGAGGVLVPLSEDKLMIDLMAQLQLPVVIVARSGLGTINHTLLTIEAIRHHHLKVAGVIMNGPANPANRHAIEHFGRTLVVAELPLLPDTAALANHPPLEWHP